MVGFKLLLQCARLESFCAISVSPSPLLFLPTSNFSTPCLPHPVSYAAPGAGKTTLLKLICGELVPTSGAVRPHPHLRMARYTQHFVDALDLTQVG